MDALELGYFDGKKGKVIILPVLKKENDNFRGQEYLGLYPFLTKENGLLKINYKLTDFKNYVVQETDFSEWINK